VDKIANQLTQKSVAPAGREPRHFGYIDAVRGLAFLAVLTLHASLSTGPFPGRDLLQGGYGVQLFFLASAITLCNSMAAREKNDKYPVFYFYLRRLFRIAPLFWCGIVFYWAFPKVMPAFWLGQWAPTGVHPSYFVLTALFLHGWHPYTFNSIVPGGWSIAVEMTFYLFFPFLFRWLNTPKKAVAAVLVSILYLKLLVHVDAMNPHSVYAQLREHVYPGVPDFIWDFFVSLWFPTQLPVFLVGFLAYYLLKNDSIKKFASDWFWAVSLFCFSLLVLVDVFRGGSHFIPGLICVVLTFVGIIVSISGEKLWWVTNPVIRYIGKISYSCYLVHFAALGITLRLFGIHLTNEMQSFDMNNSFFNLLLFGKIWVVALGLTVVLSTLTLHLIENPGIALGKKLIQRINSWSGRSNPVASKVETAN
jgi:peptidoglycan/LPS O-acetylase OafA/YrhL